MNPRAAGMGELPATVDGIIVNEAEIEDRRHLEHAGEVNWVGQLLGGHGANAIGAAQNFLDVVLRLHADR